MKMHLRSAFISLVSIGILVIPTSVHSFNIHSTARISNSNTAIRVSTTDDQTMEAMIELDLDVIQTTSTTASEKIMNVSNRKNNKRSKKKSKREDPSKDIHFLVKRTNQILSHQPVPSTKKSMNLSTFHWLIDAWTASRHPTAPEHSLGLMNSMMDYNVTPTAKTLTKVINSYAKCGRGGDIAMNIMKSFASNGESNRKQSVVIEPNIFVLNAVLEAYAKDNETDVANAIKAEQLLQSMLVTEDDQDNKKIRKKEEYSIPFGVVPDARSFQSLIRAWSSSKAEIGAAKAEQIIDLMEKLYKNKQISFRPNIIHYNTVLDAWAKSSVDSTAWHVETLIKKMFTSADDEIHPDTISYNCCINAYANAGDFKKAAALLQRMEDAYDLDKNTKIKPNTISYNGAINAFSKSLEKDAGERAEECFRRLQERYEESNRFDLDFKPDIISFSSVINAWARSFDYQKAEKAFQIYQEMLKLYKAGDDSLQPNSKCPFHYII